MRRYRFLRAMGADWLTAAFVAFLNAVVPVPSNEIRFLTVTIVMDD